MVVLRLQFLQIYQCFFSLLGGDKLTSRGAFFSQSPRILNELHCILPMVQFLKHSVSFILDSLTQRVLLPNALVLLSAH